MQTVLIPKDFAKKMKKGFSLGKKMATFWKNVLALWQSSQGTSGR